MSYPLKRKKVNLYKRYKIKNTGRLFIIKNIEDQLSTGYYSLENDGVKFVDYAKKVNLSRTEFEIIARFDGNPI